MSTYSNAHENAGKCIFYVQFPRNSSEFSIIASDFWSSTTWAIQIQVSFPGVENTKNLGIQPTYERHVVDIILET